MSTSEFTDHRNPKPSHEMDRSLSSSGYSYRERKAPAQNDFEWHGEAIITNRMKSYSAVSACGGLLRRPGR
jgi:hypothetical protein